MMMSKKKKDQQMSDRLSFHKKINTLLTVGRLGINQSVGGRAPAATVADPPFMPGEGEGGRGASPTPTARRPPQLRSCFIHDGAAKITSR